MEWLEYYRTAPRSLADLARNVFEHRAVLQRVAALAAEDGRPILEIGTGTGEMSSFLAWYGCPVVSVDRSLGLLLDAARRRRVYGLGVCQDAFRLGFAGDSFSVTFSQGLLEHFSDDLVNALVTEQLRVARRVVFSVPSRWYPRQDFGDERLMAVDDWRRILDRFRVLEAFEYGWSSRRWRHALRRRPVHLCLVLEGR